MPAGSYTVTPLESDHALMELSNGHTAVLMLTERDSPEGLAAAGRSDFAKHGDTYVLREVWDASAATGAEAIEPHAAHTRHDAQGALDGAGRLRARGSGRTFEGRRRLARAWSLEPEPRRSSQIESIASVDNSGRQDPR